MNEHAIGEIHPAMLLPSTTISIPVPMPQLEHR